MAAKVEELPQLREASKVPRDVAAKDEPLAQLREDFIKLQREMAAKDELLAWLSSGNCREIWLPKMSHWPSSERISSNCGDKLLLRMSYWPG